jgi:NADH:ubiquinone oxidoreductase subunit 6 (subunit J)
VYRICGTRFGRVCFSAVGQPRHFGEEVPVVKASHNSLNLASRPFSNRVLPWALSAIVLLISMVGLVIVVRLTTVAKKQAEVAQVEITP